MIPRLLVAALALAFPCDLLYAQCMDGSPPPCPRGRAGRPTAKVTGLSAESRITVTYAGTPLSYVLADLERATRRTIVRSVAVDTLQVSARFDDTPSHVALATVLQALGLHGFTLPSGAYAVRTSAEDKALLPNEPTVDRVLRLSCARNSDVWKDLDVIKSQRGRVALAGDTSINALILHEAVSRIEQFYAFGMSLDRKPPC